MAADDWDAWPIPNQGDNLVQHQDHEAPPQPQDSISFDQSGSTVEYLRAHGPDITLIVEDVLAGNLSDASSSEATSAEMITLDNVPLPFLHLEPLAFKRLTTISLPRMWQNHLNYPGSSALAITLKATPAQTHFKRNNSWYVG